MHLPINENHLETEEERSQILKSRIDENPLIGNKAETSRHQMNTSAADIANENEIRAANVVEFERDFTILGVTAMEDLLQDKVQECIKDFREASIRVWMLTGDKGDTAH
jgi:P-type E1-E2 ATPase